MNVKIVLINKKVNKIQLKSIKSIKKWKNQ